MPSSVLMMKLMSNTQILLYIISDSDFSGFQHRFRCYSNHLDTCWGIGKQNLICWGSEKNCLNKNINYWQPEREREKKRKPETDIQRQCHWYQIRTKIIMVIRTKLIMVIRPQLPFLIQLWSKNDLSNPVDTVNTTSNGNSKIGVSAMSP